MVAAALPKNMRILPPEEAIPILLDRARCPVVALDTEFDASKPTCQADLKGLSLAGGNKRDGYVGTFFAFGAHETLPWTYLRDKVLWPLYADPERTMVMHPPKVDMQPLRARGLRDVRCKIECTFSMVHLLDENLPKGLKDLGSSLLGIDGLMSHAQTVAAMKKKRREGEKEATAIIKQTWECYRDNRKRSKEEEVDLDPSWPSWKRLAMRLPPKLKKADVIARVGERIRSVVHAHHDRAAAHQYATYGAIDALLTIAIRDLFVDGIPGVVDPIGEDQQEHLTLETEVCHPIVTEMEERGVRINVDLMRDIYSACEMVIKTLEDDLRRLWAPSLDRPDDPEWNPGSPDQVGDILWVRWGLRPPPWTQQNGEIKPKFRIKKTGLCGTKDEVLSFLVEKGGKRAEAISKLLEWRGFTKIFGTYVGPMLTMALADPEHRIHSSFWPVGARTGRFSSSEPNLENIPRPTTMPLIKVPSGQKADKPLPGFKVERDKAKRIIGWRVRSLRDVFIATSGFKFVSADLAQVENRLIAHESQDATLLKLFRAWDCGVCGASGETRTALHACPQCGSGEAARDKTQPEQPALVLWACDPESGCGAKGKVPAEEKPMCCRECGSIDDLTLKGFCLGRDIHSMTAHSIGLVARYGFGEGRQRAKAVNHAFNYGMGANTLARREGMKRKEAQQHLDGLDDTYPGVRGYLHPKVKRGVRQDGYVEMFDGHRRRFLSARLLMASDNFKGWEWEAIIREAVNVLAQGGTGVLMKRAMIAIRNRLKREALTNPLYAAVHLVNQVHDELLYEAPDEIADEVLEIVNYEMEQAAPELSVPIIAEGATGYTWGEAH